MDPMKVWKAAQRATAEIEVDGLRVHLEVVAALRSHSAPQEVGGEWLFIKGPRLRQRLVTRDGVVALEVV